MVPSSRPFGETFCRSSGSSQAARLPVLADSGSECLNRPPRDLQQRDCSGFAPDSLLMPNAESQAATKRGKDKTIIN